MADGDIHTLPYGHRWANRVEGDDDVANIFDDKAHATAAGARMAEAGGTRHLVYQDSTVSPTQSPVDAP
ncbi:MAG: DUF2188 domain-containing protein [Actinomycetes bacterium]